MTKHMKSKLKMIALASMLVLFSGEGIAGSEGGTYIGVQYGIGDYNEDGISKSFNPTALIGRFGYFFHSSFSIEGRLGLGLNDDKQFLPEFGVGGLDAELELDSIMGIYGTGHYDLTESSSIYGVLGVSRVKGTTSVPAFPAALATEEENSVSYGIGADIGVGRNIALNIEYIRYLDKSSFDLDALGIGAVFSF